MSKTLFEKIAAREIPANIVYEDDLVLAIRDINPQAPAHVLIFPKKVIPRIAEANSDDQQLLGHLLLKAAEVAKKLDLKRRLPARHQQRRGRRRNRAAFARPHPWWTPPGLAAGLSQTPKPALGGGSGTGILPVRCRLKATGDFSRINCRTRQAGSLLH